jgi:hypothetical protein
LTYLPNIFDKKSFHFAETRVNSFFIDLRLV